MTRKKKTLVQIKRNQRKIFFIIFIDRLKTASCFVVIKEEASRESGKESRQTKADKRVRSKEKNNFISANCEVDEVAGSDFSSWTCNHWDGNFFIRRPSPIQVSFYSITIGL